MNTRISDRYLVRPLSITSGERHPDTTLEHFNVSHSSFDDIIYLITELAVANDEALVDSIHLANPNGIELSASDWSSWRNRVVRSSFGILFHPLICIAPYQHFREDGDFNFASLGENQLLFARFDSGEHVAAHLSVVDIREDNKFSVKFMLPQFSPNAKPVLMRLSSGMKMPLSPIPKSSTLPFRIATQDRLLVLELQDQKENCFFIIPSWTLHWELAQLRGETKPKDISGMVIPWEDWGPRSSAVFGDALDATLFDDVSFTTFGTRYVTVENETVVIYDFNRFAARHTTLPQVGRSQRSERGGDSHKAEFQMFSRPVTTFLPWRKLTTGLKVDPGWRVGIDHDRIITRSVCCSGGSCSP